jgi:hypothetical protein
VLPYAHRLYLAALAEFGEPVHLSRSRGYLLARPIAGTGLTDALGPYPIFMCDSWRDLAADLEALGDSFVSVTLVPDPLAAVSEAQLAAAFPDVVRPFKRHHVVELDRRWQTRVSSHHLRQIRKGLRRLELQVAESPMSFLDEWTTLYAHLVARHNIQGIARFSRASFARQLAVPGLVMVRAQLGGVAIGATLWFRAGERAYYHLGACHPLGYRERAFHAMFSVALHFLQESGVRLVSLGAGAGVVESPDDGLRRFKAGWTTSTRIAYLCGRALNRARYAELTRERDDDGFFPAYRHRDRAADAAP